MTQASAPNSSKQPFSFAEILSQKKEQARPDSATVVASDGVELFVAIYEPPSERNESNNIALVLYHGGGAHSGGGYQDLARNLSQTSGITVYLPDLRGHGASGGPRGDASSKEQVWKDVDSVLDFVTDRKANTTLYLGGHSSGGGLVVNYATEHADKRPGIEGCVLVAPELGYQSGTARPDRTDFAKVNILAFIANGIFGVMGHSKAVRFDYPPELLASDPGMVGFNTVNMANAITPESPKRQMKQLCNEKPVGLWIGADDELFVAEKVAAFVENGNTAEIVPGKNHLGILVGIYSKIGLWIQRQGKATS
mmetsp:Transcript_26632/g.37517  ORF Transcript_26632/g.37517 Transcript_26632/m.37517 type:complete len:310 (-) Transcript_26632:123-1052(-)